MKAPGRRCWPRRESIPEVNPDRAYHPLRRMPVPPRARPQFPRSQPGLIAPIEDSMSGESRTFSTKGQIAGPPHLNHPPAGFGSRLRAIGVVVVMKLNIEG